MDRRKHRKRKIKQNNKLKIAFIVLLVTFIVGVCTYEGVSYVYNRKNISKNTNSNDIVKDKNDNIEVDNKEEEKVEDVPIVEDAEENIEIEQDNNEEVVNDEITYSYGKYILKESSASNDIINFWFGRNKLFTRPGSPLTETQINSYNTHYIGEDKNVIYLTFDEGLSNTQANKNLDTLKNNNIKATFFLTDGFIKANPDIVKRMVSEGHVCGNHTLNHPNMAKVAAEDPTQFIKEIASTEDTFKSITGADMNKVIRFPEGTYSERALDYANQLGYKTIFWSFAYKDWSAEWNTPIEALEWMESYYHPGAIYLLHGVNVSNAEALDEFIKFMISKGYTFDVPTNIA